MTTRLTLQLGTGQLDEFCRQVRARERNPADALRALTTLQAFVCGFAQGDDQTVARALLDGHCEQLRADILARAAADISAAIARQSAPALADCYTRLSRSGYATAVRQALAHASPDVMDRARAWLRQWHTEVENKSAALPDAVDFRAAGITPAEYQAMRDLLELL